MTLDVLIKLAAGLVVTAAGVFFLVLGLLSFGRPWAVSRFLRAFASSARTHFLELFLRLLVGVAMVAYSPMMRFQELFRAFGWLLVVTTLALALVPWRLHRRFAAWVMPTVLAMLKWYGLSSAILGVFVLYSLVATSP